MSVKHKKNGEKRSNCLRRSRLTLTLEDIEARGSMREQAKRFLDEAESVVLEVYRRNGFDLLTDKIAAFRFGASATSDSKSASVTPFTWQSCLRDMTSMTMIAILRLYFYTGFVSPRPGSNGSWSLS